MVYYFFSFCGLAGWAFHHVFPFQASLRQGTLRAAHHKPLSSPWHPAGPREPREGRPRLAVALEGLFWPLGNQGNANCKVHQWESCANIDEAESRLSNLRRVGKHVSPSP